MKNKTCGECRHLDGDRYCNFLDFEPKPEMGGCANFEPKPTNGDKIRQMSNERLAGFISSRVECLGGALGLADCPGNQMDCVKCWEIWLNAPAKEESEVQDD